MGLHGKYQSLFKQRADNHTLQIGRYLGVGSCEGTLLGNRDLLDNPKDALTKQQESQMSYSVPTCLPFGFPDLAPIFSHGPKR